MKLYENAGARYGIWMSRWNEWARERADGFLREEKGDLIASLGWMAIMALVLVLIKGLVDGKVVGYVNNIFAQLDRVFNS
jgi:hypothetical protein